MHLNRLSINTQLRYLFFLVVTFSYPVSSEICWDYTDLTNAKVPLKCVQQGNPGLACSWSPNCNTDLDPSDCCMAVADPGATQTIGEMHVAWHDCLGNVGTTASPPPPGRGQRWYAFHRQMEWDFNEYRATFGIPKLDSLEWCPGMNMPYGHFGAGLMPGAHPLGCGTGSNRPNNVPCTNCEPFRQCLYLNGAGPMACPAPAGACSVGSVSFPYNSLDEFQSTDEIATLLDVYFHGAMHSAVSFADGGGYNMDAGNPNCSTRDGMFWRLHKALDDVVRAWQDDKAVDVTLVIDRSGSMGSASGTGVGTRLDNAKEAADMFGDLLEDGRSDGATNRLGIVSYSSNAANAALNMGLVDVDANLRNPGGPFETTLNALSPSGATSIGSGIVGAIDQLCAGGSCNGFVAGPGENQRKAILLLTDGRENTAPCLEAGCEFGGGGAEIDYTTLDATQLCAVGLGNAASINGDLLTILAERQGGIYMNNTDATGDDLKDFYAKCFAQLTDEFIGLDPNGLLAPSAAATGIMPYDSCDEGRITFSSGWTKSSAAADKLNLLVNAPNGDPWVGSPFYGEMSSEQSWSFKRAPLPYNGEKEGEWTMQLVRPQTTYVNGFTSDSFVDLKEGIAIVRREIQRLCPVGKKGRKSCNRVLYYEDLTYGDSVYQHALEIEQKFTVGEVKRTASPTDFNHLLGERWDLIVYAGQEEGDKEQVYDRYLANALCEGQKAIVTETRTHKGASNILQCAGANRDGEKINRDYVVGDADFIAVKAKLKNPGREIFSYALQAITNDNTYAGVADAHFFGETPVAVVGRVRRGSELYWHANVLVKGLTKLTPFVPFTVPRTGDKLQAAVRILPSYQRAGGYSNGSMTVELERPMQGLGGLVARGYSTDPVNKDPVDSIERQIGDIRIKTKKSIYELNDFGKDGDLHAQNGTYMVDLPIGAAVDGMYTFHYRFDYPIGSCMARRELKQTLFVEVNVSPQHSNLAIGKPLQVGQGSIYPVSIHPRDALGNQVGPGRRLNAQCTKPCDCNDRKRIVDNNDGSYTIPVFIPAGGDVGRCDMHVLKSTFSLGNGERVNTKMKPAVSAVPATKTQVSVEALDRVARVKSKDGIQ